jgi:hypothetical protein
MTKPVRKSTHSDSGGARLLSILVGLILKEGLVPYNSEGDLHARARDAYPSFRREWF